MEYITVKTAASHCQSSSDSSLLTHVRWKVAVKAPITLEYGSNTNKDGLLFSPIPVSVQGPFIARLTRKWNLSVDLSCTRTRTEHELHNKYGPVVRLAPNELFFATLPAVKLVYGPDTTCIKSSAYDNFGHLGMFQV
jgi:hypothetical protein